MGAGNWEEQGMESLQDAGSFQGVLPPPLSPAALRRDTSPGVDLQRGIAVASALNMN